MLMLLACMLMVVVCMCALMLGRVMFLPMLVRCMFGLVVLMPVLAGAVHVAVRVVLCRLQCLLLILSLVFVPQICLRRFFYF